MGCVAWSIGWTGRVIDIDYYCFEACYIQYMIKHVIEAPTIQLPNADA